MTEEAPAYDAILVVSFGGPEKREDVMPFLRNVTRGKNVPEERLMEVAEHYYHFEGKSPINDQCRQLIQALQEELAEHEIELPIYWGNRNWHPMLADTIQQMKDDGVKRALAFVTSAFSSYSGCRQYRENIETARAQVGDGAPEIDKIRVFYNHPNFIQAMADRVNTALESIEESRRKSARIAFTAHSLPVAMSEGCDYTAQLEEAARLVAYELRHDAWQVVYQSRSGPPKVPWLEPDILDHLDAISQIGAREVIVAPIGFVSDHMEVIWDLDHEAKEHAAGLGLDFVRAGAVGTHPLFVSMIRELIEERIGRREDRQALGKLGAAPDVCAPDCCKYTPTRPSSIPTPVPE